MFTKDQLINLGVEKLADIILSLCQSRPENQKQLDIIFAGLDSSPQELFWLIKREISSLKDFSDRLHCYDSDLLAGEVNKVRLLIMEELLPKSPNHSIELLSSLLDNHKKTLGSVDDVDGEVAEIFRQTCLDLVTACRKSTKSVEVIVETVYNRIMNHDNFVHDDVISCLKDVLGDHGLKLLKQKFEHSFNQKDVRFRNGLLRIADIQNDVDAYIQACSFAGRPQGDEILKIAKRLIKHGRGEEAIHWLDSMDLDGGYLSRTWKRDQRALKMKALKLCSDKETQLERLKWFGVDLSLNVYNEVLKCSEPDSVDSCKNIAIQKAIEFQDPHIALNFLIKIQEFEQAAKLTYQKINNLNGSNYRTLCPIADALCKIDPLAATLLYRKMIEPRLVRAVHDSYKSAAKDLAVCYTLSSKIIDWKGYKNHQLYFEELSVQHKRKTEFWSEYFSAANKRQKVL